MKNLTQQDITFESVKVKIKASCADQSILDDINIIQSNLSDIQQKLSLMNTVFRLLPHLIDGSHAEKIEIGKLEVVLKQRIQMLYDATEKFEISLV